MRLLFVIRDMFIGGAGKQLALTAKGLVEKGHEVFLYTYIGDVLEHFIDERIVYIPEKRGATTKLREYFLTPFHIHKQIKEVKPDIAISWRANAGFMLVLGAIGLDVKTIFSERSDPYMETSFLLKIATFICNFSDGAVFQTNQVQKYYKRLIPKSVVIPNPVIIQNKQLVMPLSQRINEIVWVGRLWNQQKRMDVALKAFKILLSHKPSVKLSIYGDGVDFQSTQLLAKSMGVGKSVIFHGAVTNIIDEIRKYRLLIHTSDYEGIPNVVLEAFQSGVPVVATDCSPGGMRVLIENGENGFIVPIGDTEALAKRCIELLDNDVLSQNFITKGLMKLDDFNYSTIINKWNEYLKNMLR